MGPLADGEDDGAPEEGNDKDPNSLESLFAGLNLEGMDLSALNLEGMNLEGLDLGSIDLGNFDVTQLAGALQSSGPLNWEVAAQLAEVVATGGEGEPEVAPEARAQLEELTLAAQTHVAAETGLSSTLATPVAAIGRKEWATLNLDALHPVLETLATTLGAAFQPEDLLAQVGDADDETNAAIAGLLPVLGPLLLGAQAGSMVGYLAQHALGRYDLPLPTADGPSLTFVVRNLDAFESDWSLERADLRFYFAIHEVVHAAERSVPWVQQRMLDLANEYVSGYVVDPTILEARLGTIDPSDPEAIQALADHPEELLGAMRSDAQVAVLDRARVFHGVLEGYADAVLERIGRPLIPSFDRIHEAMARHRIERGEAERFVEGLLGLVTGRDDYERGAAFCAGVIERAGPEALNRLWERAEMAPTPNELAAPGLWLARIDLDVDE
jgi:putative hydrolase